MMLKLYKLKWGNIVIILGSVFIWRLLHINNYNISETIEKNFILILSFNIFGLFFIYNKYFKKK